MEREKKREREREDDGRGEERRGEEEEEEEKWRPRLLLCVYSSFIFLFFSLLPFSCLSLPSFVSFIGADMPERGSGGMTEVKRSGERRDGERTRETERNEERQKGVLK